MLCIRCEKLRFNAFVWAALGYLTRNGSATMPLIYRPRIAEGKPGKRVEGSSWEWSLWKTNQGSNPCIPAMKKLVMGTHWDGLNLPSGVEWFPHKHDWKVNNEISNLDKLGRPYCTVCGGKPSFYSLKEVEEEEVDGYVKHGCYKLVERDLSHSMGCTVQYRKCAECAAHESSCICALTNKIHEKFEELGITDWWITDIKYNYENSDAVIVTEPVWFEPIVPVTVLNDKEDSDEKKDNKTNC